MLNEESQVSVGLLRDQLRLSSHLSRRQNAYWRFPALFYTICRPFRAMLEIAGRFQRVLGRCIDGCPIAYTHKFSAHHSFLTMTILQQPDDSLCSAISSPNTDARVEISADVVEASLEQPHTSFHFG